MSTQQNQKPKKSVLRRIIDKRKKEKIARLKKELDNLKDNKTLHAAAKERILEARIRMNEIRNDDNEEDSVASNMKNSDEDIPSMMLQPSQTKNTNDTSEIKSTSIETDGEILSKPKPTHDDVIEEQETLEKETKQDELEANQETVSSISESTNQEKEAEPENTEQHGTNDNAEDQNIPHSIVSEDEKTDLDKELE